VKNVQFYCKQLQNNGALKFVQFFLDHSVYYTVVRAVFFIFNYWYKCLLVILVD